MPAESSAHHTPLYFCFIQAQLRAETSYLWVLLFHQGFLLQQFLHESLFLLFPQLVFLFCLLGKYK